MAKREISDADLSEFSEAWFRLVNSDRAVALGLKSSIGEEYGTSGYFLMANIAPAAMLPDASAETILFYAVMAVYQQHKFPGSGDVWEGAEEHVARAFRFAHERGETQMAIDLLQDVLRRGQEPDGGWPGAWRKDVARAAAHELEMAELNQREVRAASLLDPAINFDSLFLTPDA